MNDAEEILLTNKSIGALNRETEQRIAEAGAAGKVFAVDLSKVPPAEWNQWLGFDVVLPGAIAHYLEGRETGLTNEEVENLELAIEDFYDIDEPYYITVSPTLQKTGRPWAFVPEAGKYLTGFTFDKK